MGKAIFRFGETHGKQQRGQIWFQNYVSVCVGPQCVSRQRKLTYGSRGSRVACNTPATAQEPVERSIDPYRQQIHQNVQSPQSARKVFFPHWTPSVCQNSTSVTTRETALTMFEPDSASPSYPQWFKQQCHYQNMFASRPCSFALWWTKTHQPRKQKRWKWYEPIWPFEKFWKW